jgi:hypothetical protein
VRPARRRRRLGRARALGFRGGGADAGWAALGRAAARGSEPGGGWVEGGEREEGGEGRLRVGRAPKMGGVGWAARPDGP